MKLSFDDYYNDVVNVDVNFIVLLVGLYFMSFKRFKGLTVTAKCKVVDSLKFTFRLGQQKES